MLQNNIQIKISIINFGKIFLLQGNMYTKIVNNYYMIVPKYIVELQLNAKY